ncbi:hypothetical protein D6D17_07495 [Aureobasidium pullulans]|nr:hypothetical protein D6D17_07495 [Aureobasidium pullulans]
MPAHPQPLCPSRFLLLHIKTMDAHQKTFPFLSLPPELRVMVYKFVFEDQTQLPRSHSLRNVSHLVHDEATPLALRCMIMVVYKSISGDQTVRTCRPVYDVTPIPSNSIISWSEFSNNHTRLAGRIRQFGLLVICNDNPCRIPFTLSLSFGKAANYNFYHLWDLWTEPGPSDDITMLAVSDFEGMLAAWPLDLRIDSVEGINRVMVESETCARRQLIVWKLH